MRTSSILDLSAATTTSEQLEALTLDPGTCPDGIPVDALAKVLGRRICGVHYFEFIVGIGLALALSGFALWTAWKYFQRQLDRMRKQNAAVVVDKLSAADLKRICGDVNLPAWVRFPDYERTGWLNELISQLWPNIASTAAGVVRDQLEPMLEQNKPSWIYDIRVRTFTLGPNPPRIAGVKVFNTESVIDEVDMELDMIWDGKQKFQLIMRPLPRIPLPLGVGAMLSKMIAVNFGVGNLFFKGRLRIAMKPLLGKPPIVGAVKISFVEPPEFSYALILQGQDLSIIPGLEAFINGFIKDSVLGPLVLPEGITVPVQPDAGRVEMPKGVLFVRVLEATNVPRMDWFGKVDPYVELYVRPRRKHKTSIVRNTYHPRWEEDFELLVHDPDHQSLTCILKDHDIVGMDEEIGRVSEPIRELPEGETEDRWFALGPPASPNPRTIVDRGLQGVRTVSNYARWLVHVPCSGHKEPPKLHLQVTFYRIGADLVKAAAEAGHPAQEDGEEDHDPRIINMLRGGVLFVTIKKGVDMGPLTDGEHGGGNMCNQVRVIVAGKAKCTAEAEGEVDPNWEETLEFALSGEVVERPDEQITVEVWDYHWVNREWSELWTYVNNDLPKQGILHIPLQQVVRDRKVEGTFPLENVPGDIDLVLEWMPILDSGAGIDTDGGQG